MSERAGHQAGGKVVPFEIEGRLDGLHPEAAFVLGAEWMMIYDLVALGFTHLSGTIHEANRDRVVSLLDGRGFAVRTGPAGIAGWVTIYAEQRNVSYRKETTWGD